MRPQQNLHVSPEVQLAPSNKRKTTAEFVRDAIRVHGETYDYSKVQYVNDGTKVEIVCRITGHGSFLQAPGHHTARRHRCPKCAANKRRTTAEFIQDAVRVHGETYDYSKVEYVYFTAGLIDSTV